MEKNGVAIRNNSVPATKALKAHGRKNNTTRYMNKDPHK
jgi:hypothetical protein